MHQLLRVPYQDNPTVPFLSPGAGLLMKRSPLLAIGALDQEGRPWCSIWGGKEGLATPTSTSSFDINIPIGKAYDPVVESLLLDSTRSYGKAVPFLAVDLKNRRRVKLFGKITAGSLGVTEGDERAGIARLTVHVDGSLGNCPKYLNAKHIVPASPEPKLISETPQLHPGSIDLLDHADCLFITSSDGTQNMDTDIRGGAPGFVRVASNDPNGVVLVYPEYSGNRLYQTLGKRPILIGKDASSILPHSNIAVRVTVTAARFVEKALSFRGAPGKPSPYKPSVRYLSSEKMSATALRNRESSVTVTMVGKEIITPSIGRFRFRISDPKEAGLWTPGQYATLSFYDELDMGYSHMMDDDPLSLNDDYIRTFTVSSAPGHGPPNGGFETTRAGLEVPLKGFGGDFRLPLPIIEMSRLQLFWSISIKDIALVLDTFGRFPALPTSTKVFITGIDTDSEGFESELEAVEQSCAHVQCRRVDAQDLDLSLANVWYFCGSSALKVSVFNWLAIEHNITSDPSTPSTQSTTRRRRPDLSSFFATLSEISSDEARSRPHAVPVPGDVSAAFYSLAEALNIMRREGGGGGEGAQAEGFSTLNPDGTPIRVHGDDLLAQMIQTLLREAETPPTEVEGASEAFCDDLDRVPRTSLKPNQSCPICSNPFLDDKYPLVVRLPCHPTHLFDLECVRPWLRLRGTCPLDRTDFAKQERDKIGERKKLAEQDEEEEWDGMYG
ncbi:hypothetical protein BDV06DRAFT_210854 [Aspergillus oleicola]